MARADRSRGPATSGRLAPALAAAGVSVLALAAWLLAPLHAARAGQPLRVVLVDASASVTRLRPEARAWARDGLLTQARAASEAGQELLALLVAKDVVVLAGPGAVQPPDLERVPLRVDVAAELATDLAGALETAERLASGRALAELCLLSDGSYTGRDPEPVLRRLESLGAERTWSPPPPVQLPDVALVRLDLPEQVEVGAPLSVRAWLHALAAPGAQALDVQLEATLSTPTGTRRIGAEASLAPERGRLHALALDLGAAERGTTRVEVRAVLVGGLTRGDAVPENDRASGEVRAGDDLRILVGANASASAAARGLAASLDQRPGLDVRLVQGTELAVALGRADVLVTVDADLRDLPAATLEGFVLAGGGWLALDGVTTLVSWPGGGVLGGLAALEPDPGEQPARDVAILLDASGSMAGAPQTEAHRAALELAAAVPASERVVLRWFTDRLEDEVEVSEDLAALLGARSVGGRTDVPGALDALAQHYTRAGGRKALALVVTDGRDQVADDSTLAGVRRRLRAAGVETALFAVGPQADLAFLERLAGPDASVWSTPDPAKLAELFRRAVAERGLRLDGPFAVSFAEAASAALARDAASASALGVDALPAVQSYVRMRARPDATVAWIAGEGEPLLGLARRGLGAVASLATLLAAEPPEGASDPERSGRQANVAAGPWDPALLDPLLRWLGRASPTSRPRLAWAEGQLRVEDVPPGWPARIVARAVMASGERQALLLPTGEALTDPRERRSGPWPWGAGAGLTVSLHAAEPSVGLPLAVLALAGETPEEVAWPPRRVSPRPSAPAPAPPAGARPGSGGSHPLGPTLLLAGLLLVAGAGLAWGRR